MNELNIPLERASRNRSEEPNLEADGPSAGPVGAIACSFCTRQFSTTRGASLHERVAHGEAYHAQRAEVIRNRVLRKARWEPEEDRLLARAVILAATMNFPSAKAENEWIIAKGHCPGRTVEAVKRRRMNPGFVALLGRIKSLSGEDRPASRRSSAEHPDDTTRRHDETRQHDDSPTPPTHSTHTTPTPTEAVNGHWLETLQKSLPAKGWQAAALSALSSRVVEGCDREEATRDLDAIVTAMTRPSRRKLAGSKGRHRFAGDSKTAQYAELQRAWRDSVSGAARRVLEGSWRERRKAPIDLETQEAYWAPLFAESSLPDDRPVSDGRTTQSLMMLPITERDVQLVQKALDRDSAPGPDMVLAREIRSAPPQTLARLFNLFLLLKHIPGPLKHSRTVLIPKIDTPSHPSHYRPITISSFIIRLFTKILANRSSKFLRLNPVQRAFIHADGCSENIHILNSILHDSRVKCKRLCVVMIDLRKAFDSVSHQSILRAFRRVGAPEDAVDLVASLYEGATTEIRRDTVVRVRRGVRQGDPLSPFLFNSVLDEALVEVTATADVGDVPPVLAFADDVVLLARTPAMLQHRINLLITALRPTGLNINAAKCSSLTMISDPKRKLYVVDQTVEFLVGTEKVRALSCVDHIRYLGVEVGYTGTGSLTSPPTALQGGLSNIKKAPLKPEQRLRILRDFLMPKLQHTLVSKHPTKGTLKKMDLTTRRSVRSWLHLPHDTPTAFYHASSADGGLGIPCLVAQVPVWRANRFEHLRTSNHPYIEHLQNSIYLREMTERCRRLGPGNNITSRAELRLHWRKRLYATVDGNGLEAFSRGPHVLEWVRGTGRVRGAAFVSAVRTMGNLLPSAARCHRGEREGRTLCEAGCRKPETLAHICQVCPRTAPCRIHRHDKVVNFVAGRLRELHHSVAVEPVLPTSRGALRPDIVSFNPTARQVTVIDAQVVADNVALDDAHKRKAQHYSDDEITALLKERYSPTPLSIKHSTATFNWRGAVAPKSARDLQALGLTLKDFRRLSTDVLLGSAACFSMFRHSTSRAWSSRRADYSDYEKRRNKRRDFPRTGQG